MAHPKFNYDKHTEKVRDLERRLGITLIDQVMSNLPDTRMEELEPSSKEVKLGGIGLTTKILQNNIKEYYASFKGGADVHLRMVLPTPEAARAHPVRWETAPHHDMVSCFSSAHFKWGEVIGVLCGYVEDAEKIDEIPADPRIFFLSDKTLRLDCRKSCNELAFVLPADGWEATKEETARRMNCQFVSCFVGGLPTHALVAINKIKPQDELLAACRDKNYWNYTKNFVVEHLCEHVWSTQAKMMDPRMRSVLKAIDEEEGIAKDIEELDSQIAKLNEQRKRLIKKRKATQKDPYAKRPKKGASSSKEVVTNHDPPLLL